MEDQPPVEPGFIPVLVASSDFWRREALRRALSKDGYSFIHAVHDLKDLEPRCSLLPNCLVILGAEALERLDIERLTRVAESAPTIVWAAGSETARVLGFIRARCRGAIHPDASPAQVRKCVRAIAAGELWFGRRALSAAVTALLSDLEAQRLTVREKQVQELVGRGYKNRAIAEALGITYDTVRWHLRSVHAKLGPASRTRRHTPAAHGARQDHGEMERAS